MTGIVPVDEFNCDSVSEEYGEDAAGPAYCTTYPVEETEINVSGCRFGDAGSILFRETDFPGAFEVVSTDSEDRYSIWALCTAPPDCEAGNANSQGFFDSHTCLQGVGYQTVYDAMYKCTDPEDASEDQIICP